MCFSFMHIYFWWVQLDSYYIRLKFSWNTILNKIVFSDIFHKKTICLWKKSLSSCWKHGIIVKNVVWLCLSYFFNPNGFFTICSFYLMWKWKKSDLSVQACNFSRKKRDYFSLINLCWVIALLYQLCAMNIQLWVLIKNPVEKYKIFK